MAFPATSIRRIRSTALLDDLGQPLDAVLLLDVRNETLMKRLAGRRICPKCGTVYNVHSMPAGATGCSRDGAELLQRPDDKEEVIGKRLEVYDRQTRPLVEHYTKRGMLRVVAGEGDLDDVFERMESAALAKPLPASKFKVAGGREEKSRSAPKRAAKAAAGAAILTVKRGTTKKKASAKGGKKKVARKKDAAKKSAPKKSRQKKPVPKKSGQKKSGPKKSAKTRRPKAAAKTTRRAKARKSK